MPFYQIPGYISGETLINQDDPRNIMVISIWQTIEDWMNWQESDEKKDSEAQFERLLQEPAEYEIYDVVSTNMWKLV
ncbi:antibiotic biosynthesis monooxygenase [bacterium]|nr:antibiotic biosynthesis monooxygenase [bacterium]